MAQRRNDSGNGPAKAIQDLRGNATGLGPASGLETSLLAQLDAAARSLFGGRIADAITARDDLGKHVEALAPGWMSEAAVAVLSVAPGDNGGGQQRHRDPEQAFPQEVSLTAQDCLCNMSLCYIYTRASWIAR